MLELQLPLRRRKLTLIEKAAVLVNYMGICHGFKHALHKSENTINDTLGLVVMRENGGGRELDSTKHTCYSSPF